LTGGSVLFRHLSIIWLLLGVCEATELRGIVTVDSKTPLRGVVVKVEVPGQVFITRTGSDGTFRISGVPPAKALVSVLQDGGLVYRNYADTTSRVTIDLESATPSLPRSFEPIALAVLSDHRVVVASRDGKLYLFSGGVFQRTVDADGMLHSVAAGMIEDEPAVFVCTSGVGPSLARYELAAASLRRSVRWLVGPSLVCDSLSFASQSGTVYIGVSSKRTIYRLRTSDKQPVLYAEIGHPGLGYFGPFAVDEARQRLFVANRISGDIFSVALAHGRTVRRFAHGLGEITALALDPQRHRLYAADSSKDRVWRFDLAEEAPAARDFAGAKNIKSAYALGVDTMGVVWVGDRKSRTLLALTPDGVLKTSITAR
jgi:hypothetical protein